jgi:hypothetical protein
LESRGVLVFVVLFQTSVYGIDVRFINLLTALNTDLLAKLLVVSSRESGYGSAINALELAPGVVIVKYIVGRILLVSSHAIPAFYNVNAIVFTIIKCVYVTHLSPFVAGRP